MSKQAISLKQAKQYLIDQNKEIIDVDVHGYVALIGTYGNDSSICQTARMTTNSNAQNDRGLLRYLLRHDHTSPFEDSILEFEVACPIFVERRWVRHRTAGLNEVSGRYCELHCETWELPENRICYEPGEGESRQGSGEKFPDDMISEIQNDFDIATHNSIGTYKNFRKKGMSCEVSRTILPLATYTRKRWWRNLHNLLHFLRLRVDKVAQKEIQNYANAISFFVKKTFPLTFEAFEDYKLNSITFSGIGKEMIGNLIKCMDKGTMNFLIKDMENKLGKTEYQEFLNKLKKCEE